MRTFLGTWVVVGIDHPREGSRKMSERARGMTPEWVSRRGDSLLLPESFNTQQERGGGLERELERSDSEVEFSNNKFKSF
jgi:hypothetical protein